MSSNDHSKGNDAAVPGENHFTQTRSTAAPVAAAPQASASNRQQVGNNLYKTHPAMLYEGWQVPWQPQMMAPFTGMEQFAHHQMYVPPLMRQVPNQAAQPAVPTSTTPSNKTVPSEQAIRTISLCSPKTAVGVAAPTAVLNATLNSATLQRAAVPSLGVKFLSPPGTTAMEKASVSNSKPAAPSTSATPCKLAEIEDAGPPTPNANSAGSANLIAAERITMKQKAATSPEDPSLRKKAKRIAYSHGGVGSVNDLFCFVPKSAGRWFAKMTAAGAVQTNWGTWNQEERDRFDKAFNMWGRENWEKIWEHVGTRTLTECYRFAKQVRKVDPIVPNRGLWTFDEHDRFVNAYHKYGREWVLLTEAVGTRLPQQVRRHADDYERSLMAPKAQSIGGAVNVKGLSLVLNSTGRAAKMTATGAEHTNTGSWNKAERDRLDEAFDKWGREHWEKIWEHVGTRTLGQCYRFAKQVGKVGAIVPNKGAWSADEVDRFVNAYQKYGPEWTILTEAVRTRSPHQVRRHAEDYERCLKKNKSAPKEVPRGVIKTMTEEKQQPAAAAAHFDAVVREGGAPVFQAREALTAVPRSPSSPFRVPVSSRVQPPVSSSPSSSVLSRGILPTPMAENEQQPAAAAAHSDDVVLGVAAPTAVLNATLNTATLQRAAAPSLGVNILSPPSTAAMEKTSVSDSKPAAASTTAAPFKRAKIEDTRRPTPAANSAGSANLVATERITMKQKAAATPEDVSLRKKAKLIADSNGGAGNVDDLRLVPQEAGRRAAKMTAAGAVQTNWGTWNQDERDRFDKAFNKWGRENWEKIWEHVGTRTLTECYRFAKQMRKVGPIVPNRGLWTFDEHDRFVNAYHRYGREWVLLTEAVETRSLIQVRRHADDYKRSLNNDTSALKAQSIGGAVNVKDLSLVSNSTGSRAGKMTAAGAVHTNTGSWNRAERDRFHEAFDKWGREHWEKIWEHVGTRTLGQCYWFAKHVGKVGAIVPNEGAWRTGELDRFVNAYQKFGLEWVILTEAVRTRSHQQVRTHATYFERCLNKDERVPKELPRGTMTTTTENEQQPAAAAPQFDAVVGERAAAVFQSHKALTAVPQSPSSLFRVPESSLVQPPVSPRPSSSVLSRGMITTMAENEQQPAAAAAHSDDVFRKRDMTVIQPHAEPTAVPRPPSLPSRVPESLQTPPLEAAMAPLQSAPFGRGSSALMQDMQHNQPARVHGLNGLELRWWRRHASQFYLMVCLGALSALSVALYWTPESVPAAACTRVSLDAGHVPVAMIALMLIDEVVLVDTVTPVPNVEPLPFEDVLLDVPLTEVAEMTARDSLRA